MKKTLYVVFLSAVFCQKAFADVLDSEYESAGILAALLMTNVVQHTSVTYEWAIPTSFVSINGLTNTVVIAGTRQTPRGQTIYLDLPSVSGSAEASVHVCTNEASAIQELCIPLVAFSSMPIEMIASRYSMTQTKEGLNVIYAIQSEPRGTDRLAMLAWGNVSIDYEGENAHANAISLLRAGGVDIPDNPPEEPPPEP